MANNEETQREIFASLLTIQKDTLISQGKILIEMEKINGKISTISEQIDTLKEDIVEADKSRSKSQIRLIAFLVVALCASAGIQVGQITGFWEILF